MDLLIYENSDMLYNLLEIITTNGKKLVKEYYKEKNKELCCKNCKK